MSDPVEIRSTANLLAQFGDELEALAAKIDAEPKPPSRRREGLLVALLAGMILALSVAAATLFDRTAVQTALAEVADAALVQRVPTSDQYVYVKARVIERRIIAPAHRSSELRGRQGFGVSVESVRQSWLSSAREGKSTISDLGISPQTADEARALKELAAANDVDLDEAVPKLTTRRREPAQSSFRIGTKLLDRAEVAKLPTESEAILQIVRESATADDDATVWGAIVDALTDPSPALPREVRSGMVDALGLLAGVRSNEHRKDPAGRDAVSFTVEHSGLERVVYFDAATSDLLFEKSVVIRPQSSTWDARQKTVVHQYMLIERGITDSIKSD